MEGIARVCEKLIVACQSRFTCLEFNLKKASRDHVSNHKNERPNFLVKSLACKFTGLIPRKLKCRSTLPDIIGEIIDTLWPLATSESARYMAGRVEPSKSIIMSQARVKSIFISTTEPVINVVAYIIIMLSINWKPLTQLAESGTDEDLFRLSYGIVKQHATEHIRQDRKLQSTSIDLTRNLLS